MESRVNALKICSLFFLILVAYLSSFQGQTQQAEQDNPNFAFSVYYTGNVRGNLEPCG
jgi:hypothetical protein